MQEFTIRNKATNPVLTLKPALMKKLLAARPESVSLALAKYRRDYKELTGKAIRLDYDQDQILLQHAGADERGMWTNAYSNMPAPLYTVWRVFVDGLMAQTVSESIQRDLELAETFYNMLDDQLAKQTPDTALVK